MPAEPRLADRLSGRAGSASRQAVDQKVCKLTAHLGAGQSSPHLPPHRQVVHRTEVVVDDDVGRDVVAEDTGPLPLSDRSRKVSW